MKKILEVEGEAEKHLIALIDAALKAGGWSVLQSVDFVRNSIKKIEDQEAKS
jgi:hypothetical protein